MKSRTLILTALSAIALLSCTRYTEEDATLVCGVPVKGTPWQLAAAIHDTGDHTFLPEEVHILHAKAYIDGWYNTRKTDHPYTAEPYEDGLLPAQVVCDIEDGEVTHAILYCKILEETSAQDLKHGNERSNE